MSLLVWLLLCHNYWRRCCCRCCSCYFCCCCCSCCCRCCCRCCSCCCRCCWLFLLRPVWITFLRYNFSLVAVFAVIYSKTAVSGQRSLLKSYQNCPYYSATGISNKRIVPCLFDTVSESNHDRNRWLLLLLLLLLLSLLLLLLLLWLLLLLLLLLLSLVAAAVVADNNSYCCRCC